MFIVCGVLYAVGGVTEGATRVELAFDLYLEQTLAVGESMPSALARARPVGAPVPSINMGSGGPVNLSLSNPYRNTTMITYNPAESGLHSWDHGHQLYYPLLFTQHVQQVDRASLHFSINIIETKRVSIQLSYTFYISIYFLFHLKASLI